MQQRNYQKELEAILSGLAGGARPRLLLHSCCGPCSSYVLEYLAPYFSIDVLFYNPNIQPEAEYEKRLFWQAYTIRALSLSGQVRLLPAPYRGGDFSAAARGLEQEPERGARCTSCFRLRLAEAARQAEAGGYAYFATTLTVSPHKDAAAINAAGEALARPGGVRWLPSDFKKRGGYQRSIQLCREHGIYRQSWCGCAYANPGAAAASSL